MNLYAYLRSALRQMKRNPGFFAVALAALALGIGANTAIFSAVEGVLLRPLPYDDPSRLVMVWEDASYVGFAHNTPAAANYVDWRSQNQVFTDMVALRYSNAAFTGDQAPEEALGRRVTPNFFMSSEFSPRSDGPLLPRRTPPSARSWFSAMHSGSGALEAIPRSSAGPF